MFDGVNLMRSTHVPAIDQEEETYIMAMTFISQLTYLLKEIQKKN
jgi:hypothetical protein